MTMLKNIIRKKLNSNECTTTTRVWSTWPFYTEAIGATGNFTYVEYVGEYSPYTTLDLENIARAAELHNMGSMMKVDSQNRDTLLRKQLLPVSRQSYLQITTTHRKCGKQSR